MAEPLLSADPGNETAKLQHVTLATGDGIGPEITAATLKVLEAAGVPLTFDNVDMGLQCWRQGLSSGVSAESLDAIRNSGVLLKGPMTTPQGSGIKSLNVTLRKCLGLYANVRPVRAYVPYVASHYPDANLVIIRENEEDLYAGIEHRQTQDVVQCLKLVSRPGCERIIRYAFEFVMTGKRKRLTCMTKDNIMKLTDGLFHEVFDGVAKEYPEVETEHMIVDIGMARVANEPHAFDVIVTPNLYGDIVSDIAAEVTGSVGLAPSANIGETISVFEAIHGSAPDIAGQNIANPSGLLLSAVKMLAHLGLGEQAELIHNAWLRTQPRPTKKEQQRQLVGVDIFVQSRATPLELATRLKAPQADPLSLSMITNRGVQVWPAGAPETFCTDHWQCRFTMPQEQSHSLSNRDVFQLAMHLDAAGLDVIKTEHLYTFDGKPGYSMGQGQ